MPFTLVGFNESQGVAALTNVAALSDEHVTAIGDDITVPVLNQIIGAFAMKTALTQLQLQSPSLRRIFLQDVSPVLNALALLISDNPFHDLKDNPIPLEVSEKLNVAILGDGTVDDGTVLVWLADGKPVQASGAIRTVRCTIPTTTIVLDWTNQILTFTQTLPAGRYAVVGMRVVAANGIAARLIFIGGSWRPGALVALNAPDKIHPVFRNGGLGIWGEFEFDQPPSVEILCSAATGAAEVWLDLIQVRSGR